jgi:hypothetical protein
MSAEFSAPWTFDVHSSAYTVQMDQCKYTRSRRGRPGLGSWSAHSIKWLRRLPPSPCHGGLLIDFDDAGL